MKISTNAVLMSVAVALILALNIIAVIKIVSLQSIVENLSKTIPQSQMTEALQQKENNSDVQVLDTSTWKTYTNEDYGFEFKYPVFLDLGEGESNTLGTADNPVKGVSIGPLIIVMSETQELKEKAARWVDGELDIADYPEKNSESYVSCSRQLVPNTFVRAVYCVGEGGSAYRAIIEDGKHHIFIDGYPYISLKNYPNHLNIVGTLLSTFKFIPSVNPGQAK